MKLNNFHLNDLACVASSKPIAKTIIRPNEYRSSSQEQIILYAIADGNYCHLQYHDGKKELKSKSLNKMHTIMRKDAYLRIHRSYIVNIAYVKSLTIDKRCIVTMVDGQELFLAESYKRQFLAHYKII